MPRQNRSTRWNLAPQNSNFRTIKQEQEGTTACKWDIVIPFEPLWAQYKRIIKDNGAIVLTASQPFTLVFYIGVTLLILLLSWEIVLK